jgi:putative ABC transport system ATP-binding protein
MSEAASPLVRIRDLHKTYGQGKLAREVLRGIDLEIAAREALAIEGVSGCGKTTLLNLLGGLDREFSGTIEVQGKSLASLSDPELAAFRNQTVGFVFQHFHLLDALTLAENVCLPAAFGPRAMPPRAALERAREVLERVGLADRLGDLPTRLSGGQKQRVAIARSLFFRPPLLLCDEPTGNLDTHTGQQILDLFASLQQTEGVTLVIVTHEARVSSVARRRIRMEDGRILSETRSEEGP